MLERELGGEPELVVPAVSARFEFVVNVAHGRHDRSDDPPRNGLPAPEALGSDSMAGTRGNERFVEDAAARGIEVLATVFPEGTKTSAEAARAIGCTVAQIAKSVVLVAKGGTADGTVIVAITSGANRVDTEKVAALVGATAVRTAKPDEVRESTGYAIGGVPPFAHASPLRCLLDEDLLEFDEVWSAAGTPDACFPITPARLVEASRATVADVKSTPLQAP